jgi:hypothetical protein
MAEGDPVGVTLVMPSMITLAENMRVRCHGKVLRVLSAQGTGSVVAVQVEKYEYLPETDGAPSISSRIGALHEHPHELHDSAYTKGIERTSPRALMSK